jgi:hypothetical protein
MICPTIRLAQDAAKSPRRRSPVYVVINGYGPSQPVPTVLAWNFTLPAHTW